MQILELQLLSDDLEGTEKFYTSLLEYKLIEKTERTVTFSVGATKLKFIRSVNTKACYHFAFNIPTNKLQEAFEWINAKKIDILPITPTSKIADFFSSNASSFYFFDNNKNILEFITRVDLNVTSGEPFNTNSIISVSEIGIVTDDVHLESKKILEEYKIPVYSKWKQTAHFTAQGDENGLLILSEEGRHWYPTDIEAKKFPSRIKLKQANVIHEINIQ